MGAENQWSLLAEVVEGNFTEVGIKGVGAENQWSLLAEAVEGNFTEEGLEGYKGGGEQ